MSNARVSSATLKQMKSYHHTFEIRKNDVIIVRHTLLLNPQSYSQTEQARVNVTQTLGGSYVVDFGAGLPTVSISGTTGYSQRYNDDGEYRDGYEEFMHFRNKVYREFIETNDPDYTMFWYNWEDKEYWRIQPTSFRLQRSVSESLLYRYEFAFTGLEKANVSVKKVSNANVDALSLDTAASSKRILIAISNASEVIASLS